MQKQHRLIRRERKEKEEEEREQSRLSSEGPSSSAKQPKFFELRPGEEFKGIRQGMKRKQILK